MNPSSQPTQRPAENSSPLELSATCKAIQVPDLIRVQLGLDRGGLTIFGLRELCTSHLRPIMLGDQQLVESPPDWSFVIREPLGRGGHFELWDHTEQPLQSIGYHENRVTQIEYEGWTSVLACGKPISALEQSPLRKIEWFIGHADKDQAVHFIFDTQAGRLDPIVGLIAHERHFNKIKVTGTFAWMPSGFGTAEFDRYLKLNYGEALKRN